MGQAADSLQGSSIASHAPRLIDRFRAAIRSRHYSRRTEEAYVHWIKRLIYFHGKRHPARENPRVGVRARGREMD